MEGPILTRDIESWFERQYPDVPYSCVRPHTGSIDWSALDPYETRAVILYTEDDIYYKVHGLLHYASCELTWDPPALPLALAAAPPPPVRAEGRLTLDMILARCDAISRNDYSLLVPPIDNYLLTVPSFAARVKTYLRAAYGRFSDAIGVFEEIRPALEDLQWCFREHPDKARPEVWYKVPIEVAATAACASMRLWPGGYLHVPAFLVGESLYRHREMFRNFPTTIVLHPKQEAVLLVYIRRRYAAMANVDKYVPAEILKDPAHLPPCIAAIVDSPAFPKDTERQQLVRTLRRAGFTLEAVEELFTKWDTNPRRRWDYEHHYRANYPPPPCEKMKCPFGTGPIVNRKSACYSLFCSRFPGKAPRPKLYGPVVWFEW